MTQQRLVVYVDVDDTLVRTIGTKRVPISAAIRHVQELHRRGAELYCWSSGGASYAEASATELGLHDCFTAFLPKPDLLVDDQHPNDWRRLVHIHPAQVDNMSFDEYLTASGRAGS